MDYNKKILITVKSVENLMDKNLVKCEYTNQDNELIDLAFSVEKKFLIKEKQILSAQFKKFFEVDFPLPVALGALSNLEIHNTAFPCRLIYSVNNGQETKYSNDEDFFRDLGF